MKILIATDSFKDYKSATDICAVIAEGLQQLAPNATVVEAPLADGGEGSLEALQRHLALAEVALRVKDPLMRTIKARYLYDGGRQAGYVAMSEASGLELLEPTERNCYHTTTYGTGQLIADLVAKGLRELHLFVGGSATCDAGLGMLVALGGQAIINGAVLDDPRGKDLVNLDKIVLPPWPHQHIRTRVYADVDNPLYGPQGAAYVYGKQKGASSAEIQQLDKGLQHFADLVQKQHGMKVNIAGAGAAGGIVAGAIAGMHAQIDSGADFFCRISDLQSKITAADLVITGEGKLDQQTVSGKLVSRVCQMAQGKPVIAICGKNNLGSDDQRALGIAKVIALKDLDLHQEAGPISDTLHHVAGEIYRFIIKNGYRH